MNNSQRREKILNCLRTQKSIPVNTLIQMFGVSGMTIRRDLDYMVQHGLVTRSYGQVSLATNYLSESTFDTRQIKNLPEKQSIAACALPFFKECDSVFLDGSTTCNELVKLIPPTCHTTVYTNSIASFLILRQLPHLRIFFIGGFLAADRNTVDGTESLSLARDIYVDATFISCSGFSREGIVNSGSSGSHLKSIMLKNAHHRYLLADHTKQDIQGLYHLSNWPDIDTLITDRPLDSDFSVFLENAGVSVLVSE